MMWLIVSLFVAVIVIAVMAPPPPGRRSATRLLRPEIDDDLAASLSDPVGTLAKRGYLADPRRWEDEGLGEPYESPPEK